MVRHIYLKTLTLLLGNSKDFDSVAGVLNCGVITPNFIAATIEECCLENPGFFFEDTTGDEFCTACIGMK